MKEHTQLLCFVLVVVAVLFVIMSCRKEGMSARPSTVRAYSDDTYSKILQPSYSLRREYMSHARSCNTADDCGPQETCVSPGAYTDGTVGYCMNENEPGIPTREGYHNSRRCSPTEFYNARVRTCQPRWQGSSSAAHIRSEKPGPEPHISIPGSVTPGYGVGHSDPFDVPVPGYVLETAQ